MDIAVKTISIVAIVLGGCAILGSLDPSNPSGVVGGMMFLGYGILTLVYVGKVREERKKVQLP